jgi:hypothetical protein
LFRDFEWVCTPFRDGWSSHTFTLIYAPFLSKSV